MLWYLGLILEKNSEHFPKNLHSLFFFIFLTVLNIIYTRQKNKFVSSDFRIFLLSNFPIKLISKLLKFSKYLFLFIKIHEIN